jgi:hypothetical protein
MRKQNKQRKKKNHDKKKRSPATGPFSEVPQLAHAVLGAHYNS